MISIGRIYGEIIGEKFTFASKQFFCDNYVKIVEDENRADSAELICEVTGRGISNKYLATPEIVKYLDDNMNFQRDTIFTYTAIPIGAVRNGVLTRDNVNTIPGKNVYPVSPELLQIVYGIEKNDKRIGYLKRMTKCDMTLGVNRIFNPHLFIVGKTGSGKSYFMRRYLEGLNENIWLFAPSDEYDDAFANHKKGDYVLELNVDNISYYINLNASEELILRNVNFKKDVVYSYRDLIEEIYTYYRKGKYKKDIQLSLSFVEEENAEIELPTYANSLIGKLKNIRHLRFTKNSRKLQLPKMSMAFDLSDYTQLEQECILNYFLFKLLQKCKNTKEQSKMKHIIIVEEAHKYVPSVKNALSKEIIIQLAREGRKYGISLCFITQRPRFFDQTALSQSGNRIIFSLPNPDDVKHVMEEIPFYRPELAWEIQKQKTGECVIAGDAYNDVLQVVIDDKGSVKCSI